MAIQANVGSRVGDYILVKKLGEGGMAEVWLARHVTSAQLRAIKFLNSQFQGIPEVEARFQNEGESKLVHPNIVRVYEVGQEAGSSYLVMEFVDGQDLENILNSRRGPLTVPESLDIGTQILAGLGFAHSNGIIHRDIKPSNVLVDREGHAFVMDFGIAKVLRTGRMLTQVNSRLGTPDYMSPEQIRNPRDVDHRSDIYSFGCLFYELLTGWPPFDRGEGYETEHDIKTAHVTQPPTPPMVRKTGLPAELNQITLQCLEKSQADRPQSCEEVIRALAAYRATIARPAVPSRSATVVDTTKPSTGPGIPQRRETVVLPHGGIPESPNVPPVTHAPEPPIAKPGGFNTPVRTPTVIDTGQPAGNVATTPSYAPSYAPSSTPYTPQVSYASSSTQAGKGISKALIAAGILLVLIALSGGGWVLYRKHQDDVEAQKAADELKNKIAQVTVQDNRQGTTTDHPKPAVNPKPVQGDSGSVSIPAAVKKQIDPPNRHVDPVRPPDTQTVLPIQKPKLHSGTLIWTGDATATRGHVTIVRSGNFAMPGGQLTGAMFPAAPLHVTTRTAGATIQLPKQQTSYNSLDLYLPNPGQQTVYIDWNEVANP